MNKPQACCYGHPADARYRVMPEIKDPVTRVLWVCANHVVPIIKEAGRLGVELRIRWFE